MQTQFFFFFFWIVTPLELALPARIFPSLLDKNDSYLALLVDALLHKPLTVQPDSSRCWGRLIRKPAWGLHNLC
ncbi:hypothetical protein V8C37DRAFT_355251 [Trichoderma ceciliae]